MRDHVSDNLASIQILTVATCVKFVMEKVVILPVSQDDNF